MGANGADGVPCRLRPGPGGLASGRAVGAIISAVRGRY